MRWSCVPRIWFDCGGLNPHWAFNAVELVSRTRSVRVLSQSPLGFQCGGVASAAKNSRRLVSIPIGLSMRWSRDADRTHPNASMSQSPLGFQCGGAQYGMKNGEMAASQSPLGFQCGGVGEGRSAFHPEVSIPIGLSMRWRQQHIVKGKVIGSQSPLGFQCGGG